MSHITLITKLLLLYRDTPHSEFEKDVFEHYTEYSRYYSWDSSEYFAVVFIAPFFRACFSMHERIHRFSVSVYIAVLYKCALDFIF